MPFLREARPPLASFFARTAIALDRDKIESLDPRSLARDQVQFVTNGKSVIGSGILFIIAGQSCGLAEQDRKPHDRTANTPRAIYKISVSSYYSRMI